MVDPPQDPQDASRRLKELVEQASGIMVASEGKIKCTQAMQATHWFFNATKEEHESVSTGSLLCGKAGDS
jgi:hypothetical protein